MPVSKNVTLIAQPMEGSGTTTRAFRTFTSRRAAWRFCQIRIKEFRQAGLQAPGKLDGNGYTVQNQDKVPLLRLTLVAPVAADDERFHPLQDEAVTNPAPSMGIPIMNDMIMRWDGSLLGGTLREVYDRETTPEPTHEASLVTDTPVEDELFDKATTITMAPITQAEADAAMVDGATFDLLEAVLPRTQRSLLYGPPATGKTHIAIQIAKQLGIELSVICMTDQMPAAELRGHFVPKGAEWIFMYGNALRPFKYGGLLLVDELDEAGADALAFLTAILNDPSVAKLTLPTGETVSVHPNFRVIGCMNGHPSDLHPRLQSRFPVQVYVDRPNPKAILALPQDLQAAASKLTIEQDERTRVDIRQWLEFAKLREQLGHEQLAAKALFGARSGDILAAIKAINDLLTQAEQDAQDKKDNRSNAAKKAARTRKAKRAVVADAKAIVDGTSNAIDPLFHKVVEIPQVAAVAKAQAKVAGKLSRAQQIAKQIAKETGADEVAVQEGFEQLTKILGVKPKP
ncbi:MAG: AAA family ATPase [Dehalococcoidia bacterium]